MAAFPSSSAPPNTSGLATTAGPRLLYVHHSGTADPEIRILGPDKSTVLYAVDFFSSKPHLTVRKVDTNTVVGTATFHSLSRTVDLVIHNRPIPFFSPGILTRAHEWKSLASTIGGAGQGMRFQWKMGGWLHRRDMSCSDQENTLCAKFEKKDERFEVGASVSGGLMDEVIVSGLAMLGLQRKRGKNTSAGSRGVSGGDGGGGDGGGNQD